MFSFSHASSGVSIHFMIPLLLILSSNFRHILLHFPRDTVSIHVPPPYHDKNTRLGDLPDPSILRESLDTPLVSSYEFLFTSSISMVKIQRQNFYFTLVLPHPPPPPNVHPRPQYGNYQSFHLVIFILPFFSFRCLVRPPALLSSYLSPPPPTFLN